MAANPPPPQPVAPGAPVPLPPVYAGVPVGPSRSRHGLLIAGTAVIAIVVVLLVVFATGLIPWFKSSTPGGTGFAAQRSSAQHVADSYPGGPWTLVAVAGLLPSSNVTGTVNSTIAGTTAIGSGCNLSSTGPSSIFVPSVANVSSGQASDWVFLFRAASGNMLVANEVNSSVTVLGTLSGGSCTSSSGLGTTQPVPGSVVDPTAAAATANSNGGTAFMRAHPHANGTVVLIGGISLFGFSTGALWVFLYTNCPLTGSTATSGNPNGAGFYAAVNATQGTLIQASSTSTQCAGAPVATPLGTALAVGAPREASAGSQFWYNFSVESATSGLLLENLSFQVETPTGAVVTLASPTVDVLGISGSTLATYNMATGSWTSGGLTQVSNQMTICLGTSTNLIAQGDVLVISGLGSYTGSISVAIP